MDIDKILKVLEDIYFKENYEEFQDNLKEFSKNFLPDGAENSAKIAAQILEEKR